MLFHLICTASALLASGGDKKQPWTAAELGALPLHADPLAEHEPDFQADHEAHKDLHEAILNVHKHAHDLLDVPAIPGGENHDARLKAILAAFKAQPDPDAKAPEAAPAGAADPEEGEKTDPNAAADPALPDDPTAGEAADPDPESAAGEAKAEATEGEEPAEAAAPADPAAGDGAGEAAPEEAAPAEAPAETAKAAAVDEHEQKALAKIGKSLKTMTVLHVLMQPMLQKLKAAAEQMQGAPKEHAERTMGHLAALDMYSEKAVEMLSVIQHAESGTPEEKAQAIQMLEMGLIMIKAGIQKHMQALKGDMHQGVDGEIIRQATKGHGVAGKLQAVVAKMEAKVRLELQDPKRAHDPLVALDVDMLQAMKTAVAKSEALVVVTAKEMKKHPEDADKFKTALKTSLHQVTAELRKEMDTLKKKAMLIAIVTKMAQKKRHDEAMAKAAHAGEEAEKKEQEAEAPKKTEAPPAEKDAPPPSGPMENALNDLDEDGIGHAPAQHAPTPEQGGDDEDNKPPPSQEPVQHKAEEKEQDEDLPEPHADSESLQPAAEPEHPAEDPAEAPEAPKLPGDGDDDAAPSADDGPPVDDGEEPAGDIPLEPKDEPKGMDEPKGLSELEQFIKKDEQLRKQQ